METTTPKIIFQTWKSYELPKKLKVYSDAWKRTHSDYQHILLNDNDLRRVIVSHFPQYTSLYDSFTDKIERIDFARYAILYVYGGVYADLDTIPKQRIDKFVETNKIVLASEPSEHTRKLYLRNQVLCNAFMISPPKQKFWKELMEYINVFYEPYYKAVNNTGPLALQGFYDEIKRKKDYKTYNLHIANSCDFYSMTNIGEVSKECTMKSPYVYHIWENTWVKPFWESGYVFNDRYLSLIFLCLFVIIWVVCAYKQK